MAKTVYQEEKTTIDKNTGEVLSEEKSKVVRIPSEPSFIKLYVEDISKLYNLPRGTDKLLFELLKHMSYEGQICLNSGMKRIISEKLNIQNTRTIDNNLSRFVKSNILDRVETGVYIANPNLFGKGSWADIYKLRKLWVKRTYTKNKTEIETPFTEKENKEKNVSGGN
ncbi:replication/maintenance protein RepL [Alcanivorax sp.]|uniref:replication/maintenance protein RepL n=1 Tax=Alcanivorax sp. TaxID=1872427 RepID=UPI003A92D821